MVLVKKFGQYRANIVVAIGILFLVKSMQAHPCTRKEVNKIKGVQCSAERFVNTKGLRTWTVMQLNFYNLWAATKSKKEGSKTVNDAYLGKWFGGPRLTL